MGEAAFGEGVVCVQKGDPFAGGGGDGGVAGAARAHVDGVADDADARIGGGAVLVGISERTTAAGVERREHRSFQQVTWTAGRVGPGDLSTRTRLEQRWLSDGNDTGWRLRQMVRYRVPFRATRGGVALLGWVEPFVALNTTDWGARAGFDQVRSFAGLEIPAGGRSTTEIGYLNQTIDRGGGRRQMNHVASVTVFFRH